MRSVAVGLMLALPLGAGALLPASGADAVLPGVPAPANLKQPLTARITMEQALNSALANNPRTAAARSQLGVTHAALTQASILPNPGVYFDNQYLFTYKIGASIVFEPPWKIMFRRAAARQQIAQTDIDIARQLWLFRGEVRRLYAEAAIARRAAEIRKELLGITQRLAHVSRQRFEGGDVPRLDVHRADLAVAQAELQVEQTEILLAQANEQLNIILGQPHDLIEPLEWQDAGAQLSTVELPAEDALMRTAVASRMELKLALQNKVVNEANLKVAYGNIAPSPRFNVGRMTEDKINSKLDRKSVFFQGLIDVPVFDFQQGNIARIRALRTLYSNDYFAQRNIVLAQTALAYRKLQAARARIDKYRNRLLAIADNISQSSVLSYRMGQSDITTTLLVQQENINIQSQYLDSVLAYQLALNDLEQAVGVPLQ